jgi:hypothetical protein
MNAQRERFLDTQDKAVTIAAEMTAEYQRILILADRIHHASADARMLAEEMGKKVVDWMLAARLANRLQASMDRYRSTKAEWDKRQQRIAA